MPPCFQCVSLADNAAAVTEHAHDAAVLPVRFLVFIGKFHDTQQILGGIAGNLIIQALSVFGSARGKLLDIRYKAGPGPGFELVQQGGCMFRHCLTSTWLIMGLSLCQPMSRKNFPFRQSDP